MGALIIEELNGEPYEVVSVPGHQASFLRRCKIELPLVRCLAHVNLMSTAGIDSALSKYFSNLRTEVFIKVKFHNEDLMKV